LQQAKTGARKTTKTPVPKRSNETPGIGR